MAFKFLVYFSLTALALADPSHLQNLYNAPAADTGTGFSGFASSGSNGGPAQGSPFGLAGSADALGSISAAELQSQLALSQPGSIQPSGDSVSSLVQPSIQIPIQNVDLQDAAYDQAITITEVVTEDVFRTSTNLFYNTIPVTLSEFFKTTVTVPTRLVTGTAVDDLVFVATVPVTKTDVNYVTDVITSYQYYTEISTAVYTVTHRAYDIQQQLITSTVVETQVYKPTVVSTRVLSETDTSTVEVTITHTAFLDARQNFQGVPLQNTLNTGHFFPGVPLQNTISTGHSYNTKYGYRH